MIREPLKGRFMFFWITTNTKAKKSPLRRCYFLLYNYSKRGRGEMVYTQGLGPCGCKGVGVQVLSPLPSFKRAPLTFILLIVYHVYCLHQLSRLKTKHKERSKVHQVLPHNK